MAEFNFLDLKGLTYLWKTYVQPNILSDNEYTLLEQALKRSEKNG